MRAISSQTPSQSILSLYSGSLIIEHQLRSTTRMTSSAFTSPHAGSHPHPSPLLQMFLAVISLSKAGWVKPGGMPVGMGWKATELYMYSQIDQDRREQRTFSRAISRTIHRRSRHAHLQPSMSSGGHEAPAVGDWFDSSSRRNRENFNRASS